MICVAVWLTTYLTNADADADAKINADADIRPITNIYIYIYMYMYAAGTVLMNNYRENIPYH